MATLRQDFTDDQKSALVQRVLSGGLSLEQACALYGLSTEQLKDWVCLFRRAVRQALDHQLRDTLSIHGLEPDELARPQFSGSLTAIGVDDLLHTIQMGRKDAHITVNHGGQASEIWCRAGEVVDACSGSLEGEKAFYRILAIERGSVVADFAPNDRARRIELPLPRLLLEAASNTGLRARLMQRIGDPALVFALAGARPTTATAGFEPDEVEVLGLFDGTRSVEEIVLLSGLSDARALEIVAHLREQQVIVSNAPPRASKPALESAPPSGHITMSYGSSAPGGARRSVWLRGWRFACGAVLCSSLGAVATIAYTSRGEGPTFRYDAAPPRPAASRAREEPAAAAREPIGAPVSIPSSAASAKPGCPERMVWIEGGEFTMGSDSRRPALTLARPAHRIRVSGFCLGQHEVTVQEYAACSDAGQCTPAHTTAHFAAEATEAETSPASVALHGALCNAGADSRRDHPINCISHTQAAEYCRARGGRLPSEAEWEFAARGTSSRAFPWGETKPTRSHINACGQECKRWHASRGLAAEVQALMYPTNDGFSGTAPVGSFPLGATPERVADLIGNVFEWTADGLYDYESSTSANPRGPADSESFVIRGGNFNSGIREFADPALRFAMHGESYSHGVGFRCAAKRIAMIAEPTPSAVSDSPGGSALLPAEPASVPARSGFERPSEVLLGAPSRAPRAP